MTSVMGLLTDSTTQGNKRATITSFHGYTSGDNTSGCSVGMQRREGYRRVRRGTIRYVGNSFTAGSQVDGSQRYALSNALKPCRAELLRPGMLPKYRSTVRALRALHQRFPRM